MKILLSAYACEPGRGSEPGVGWSWASHLAQLEEVWVLTRANNRPAIEEALVHEPNQRLHFLYYDLPRWARSWKKGSRGLRLYYYLWQFGAWWFARKAHREIGFDVAHHVTFVKYWMPSFLAWLPVPLVWGPVGGGESAPWRFWWSFSGRGKIYEIARDVARGLGRLDPFVRSTARRATVAMATTAESAAAIEPLGARFVVVCSEAGMTDEEIRRLAAYPPRDGGPFRLLSVGNLIHLKGFDLALRAFARFAQDRPEAEYWLIGGGPEREKLERMAETLGVRAMVTFWGELPRRAVLEKLAECDALAHPSLHDSGGWVCLEAMAAGRPVVCLDLGGPGAQVTRETGIKVPAVSPKQVVSEMAEAFRALEGDRAVAARLAEGGRRRVAEEFAWRRKAAQMVRVYEEALRASTASSRSRRRTAFARRGGKELAAK